MSLNQTLPTTPTSTQSKPASPMTAFRLSNSNYYSQEANQHFQSASMFKGFQSCEARAMAQLNGWKPAETESKALLVGNYVHSYFESPEAHRAYIEDNKKQMISSQGKTKGKLKSDYRDADRMIAALNLDKRFQQSYMAGQKEIILTGKIGGVPWMGKLDSYIPGQSFFMDLKTVEDMHKRFWIADPVKGHWGSFIEDRNYPLQMAVYQELIEQKYHIHAEPIIVAVTKQNPPDKAFVAIPQEYLDTAMSQLLEVQDHIEAVRSGRIPPKRCEQCDYCRATKHLGQIISMNELIE
ncbi:MAG: PD-(D/E)XK nuclease-like domain-containing protein [Schleiferilactobacillus perolens]|uniref:PD-(D/E)XK nuclease-like domain-containing protein n=2 Tax=Schleiferilactobacillus perolens TaxID=100468 RepID=UPI0039E8B25A